MSKTTIVGGKILESTGGDFNIYAKENIVYSSATTITETGVEKGVNFGDPIKYVKTENAVLRQFLVHFRRPSDYDGKYGFDWLRDEYIFPIMTVTHDTDGTPINRPTALCKNPSALKAEYRITDVKNPISPYGKEYFSAWLAIFPHTTTAQFAHGSRMHSDGVSLDIEIEEIEPLANDATEILFECSNRLITITPSKLNLSALIGSKQSKNLGGSRVRNYYHNRKKINIKCSGGALASNEEIKVFAKLGQQKTEVGKLMVSRNNSIPKAEIVAVNVISSAAKPQIKEDYQYLFKNQSFNQALIRAEVRVDTEFDLVTLAAQHADARVFLNNSPTMSSEDLKTGLVTLYEKYGTHKPDTNSGSINYTARSGTTRTYLFYTEFEAGNVLGSCSLDANNNWGNSYIIYKSALKDKHTIIHEAAHSFGLPHVFQGGSFAGPYTFYHGYTDNYMDYTWQMGARRIVVRNGRRVAVAGSSGPNVHRGNMHGLYKWQWKMMRSDRSLISNY